MTYVTDKLDLIASGREAQLSPQEARKLLALVNAGRRLRQAEEPLRDHDDYYEFTDALDALGTVAPARGEHA